MKNKRGKIIVFTCFSLLTVSALVLASVIFVISYSNNNIDSENDERLFSLTRGSSMTEYYVDSGRGAYTIEEYEPILRKSVALGETQKRWIELSGVPQDLVNGFLAVEDRNISLLMRFLKLENCNIPA